MKDFLSLSRINLWSNIAINAIYVLVMFIPLWLSSKGPRLHKAVTTFHHLACLVFQPDPRVANDSYTILKRDEENHIVAKAASLTSGRAILKTGDISGLSKSLPNTQGGYTFVAKLVTVAALAVALLGGYVYWKHSVEGAATAEITSQIELGTARVKVVAAESDAAVVSAAVKADSVTRVKLDSIAQELTEGQWRARASHSAREANRRAVADQLSGHSELERYKVMAYQVSQENRKLKQEIAELRAEIRALGRAIGTEAPVETPATDTASLIEHPTTLYPTPAELERGNERLELLEEAARLAQGAVSGVSDVKSIHE